MTDLLLSKTLLNENEPYEYTTVIIIRCLYSLKFVTKNFSFIFLYYLTYKQFPQRIIIKDRVNILNSVKQQNENYSIGSLKINKSHFSQ